MDTFAYHQAYSYAAKEFTSAEGRLGCISEPTVVSLWIGSLNQPSQTGQTVADDARLQLTNENPGGLEVIFDEVEAAARELSETSERVFQSLPRLPPCEDR